MNRMHPQTLLFVLLGTVPLVVAGAGLAAFLLMRAEFGFLVWGVVPFVVSLVVVAGVSYGLSRAARADRRVDGSSGGRTGGRRRGRDGV